MSGCHYVDISIIHIKNAVIYPKYVTILNSLVKVILLIVSLFKNDVKKFNIFSKTPEMRTADLQFTSKSCVFN